MSQDDRVPFDNEITTRMISNLSENLESSNNLLSTAFAHLVNVKKVLRTVKRDHEEIQLHKETMPISLQLLMGHIYDDIRNLLQSLSQIMPALHGVKMMRKEIADFIAYCRDEHRQGRYYMPQRQMKALSMLSKKD